MFSGRFKASSTTFKCLSGHLNLEFKLGILRTKKLSMTIVEKSHPCPIGARLEQDSNPWHEKLEVPYYYAKLITPQSYLARFPP